MFFLVFSIALTEMSFLSEDIFVARVITNGAVIALTEISLLSEDILVARLITNGAVM